MGSKGTRTPLRILCFGDSLTGGYPPAHPYADILVEKLQAAFPTHHVDAEVDGVPGDQVTNGSFLWRMAEWWKTRERKDRFDWTIVLGGTNDIVWNCAAEQVLQSLMKVYDIPLSKGAKVLALTIPECRLVDEDLDNTRDAINEGIMTCKRQNLYTFDLQKAVPYYGMSHEDRRKYWAPDGLHFTEKGYDLIGEKIAECLIKILHLEEAQSTEISSIITNARQKRLIEELMFEEEQGNPKLLSQGWIVVRKRDLD